MELIGSLHGPRHHTPRHLNALALNVIRFHHSVESGRATLRPAIDELDLLSSYTNDLGVHPDRLLPPLSSLLLPSRTDHRVLIGCCSCGETGCGSLALRLRRSGDQVLWGPDEHHGGESLARGYRFDLRQYLDAIDDASEDRPGEGRGSRVARRLRLSLGLHDQAYDSLTPFQLRRVDWISAWSWDSDVVEVFLTGAQDQQVLAFSATPDELDQDFAGRIATGLDDQRYGRLGTE